MALYVPYRYDTSIEKDAEDLLEDFAKTRGLSIVPPIPVEDIVEKQLKLRFELDDLHALFGLPRPSQTETDILGVLYGDGRILVDETLDPDDNPEREGRFRFTLGHEAGHARLHSHLLRPEGAQPSSCPGPKMPSFICRSREAKERVEWQADYFASCLLMPKKLVFEQWAKLFGDVRPRAFNKVLYDGFRGPKPEFFISLETAMQLYESSRIHAIILFLSNVFNVSYQAMNIRLERKST